MLKQTQRYIRVFEVNDTLNYRPELLPTTLDPAGSRVSTVLWPLASRDQIARLHRQPLTQNNIRGRRGEIQKTTNHHVLPPASLCTRKRLVASNLESRSVRLSIGFHP